MAETLVNKTQAGEGIWTADNLIAGTDISITQVPQPLIDENTLGVWHFENNLNNAVSGSSYTVSSSTIVASNSQYKFGDYSLCSSSGSTGDITLIDQALPSGDFTVDYWLRTGNSSPSLTIGLNTSSDLRYGPTRQGLYINQNSTFIGFNTTSSGGTQGGTSYGTTIETASWHHIAMVRESNTVKYYLDGVLQSSKAAPSTYYLQANFNYQAQGINYVPQFIDELRLSNIARWTSDFTPYTEPYAASAGPAKYQINNTKADPDLSSYLQNTATGTGSLTIEGVAATAGASVNFGVGSQATGSYAHSLGYYAQAGTRGVAVGHGAQATGNMATSIGDEAKALKSEAVALGKEANANAGYALAIGSRTTASAQYSIAIGCHTLDSSSARATATSAIQLGNGTNSTASTFQVFNTTVVNASGKIPAANLDTTIPDVTTKADTDLSNVNSTGKSTSAGWAMPSSTASAVSLSTSSTNTMTSAGWVIVGAHSDNIGFVNLQIGNTTHKVCSSYTGGNAQSFNYYPVYAGEAVNIATDGTGAIDVYVFVPCAGVN